MNIFGRKFNSRFNGLRRILDLVKLLEIGFQAFQNVDRIFNIWFFDIDFLEPTNQRPVLFKMLAIFFVGGRPNAAQ